MIIFFPSRSINILFSNHVPDVSKTFPWNNADRVIQYRQMRQLTKNLDPQTMSFDISSAFISILMIVNTSKYF